MTQPSTTMTSPTSTSISEDAVAAVLAERHNSYGHFINNARMTENLLAAMDGSMQLGPGPNHWLKLDADQRQALHLIATKISRLLTGDPNHVDSWQDIAGYAQLIVDRLQGKGAYAIPLAQPRASSEPSPVDEQPAKPQPLPSFP